jgi:hypothetical protein
MCACHSLRCKPLHSDADIKCPMYLSLIYSMTFFSCHLLCKNTLERAHSCHLLYKNTLERAHRSPFMNFTMVRISSMCVCRVLLHHRSDNLVFALVLGGARLISVGEGVECKIKGVLQVYLRISCKSSEQLFISVSLTPGQLQCS